MSTARLTMLCFRKENAYLCNVLNLLDLMTYFLTDNVDGKELAMEAEEEEEVVVVVVVAVVVVEEVVIEEK